MKYFFLFTVALFFAVSLSANDGAFFANGNQLIPMGETDIRVQKEILSIKRIDKEAIEVTVYYEFLNPKEAKKMIVGFEAASPNGDADTAPSKEGGHPYIQRFTVNMNGAKIPHRVAIVNNSHYYKNGKIDAMTLEDALKITYEGSADFNYVYHFDADFKKGVNIIKHTYTFDMSGSIDYNFHFHYILSAALRWGNKQIDDFTLNIDMGGFADFCINDGAFGKNPKWMLKGVGKTVGNELLSAVLAELEGMEICNSTHFYMRNGQIEFKAKNFRPKHELYLFSIRRFPIEDFICEDYTLFSPDDVNNYHFDDTIDDLSRRILRNLPFARRGYIFSTPEIQKYYSKQSWYMPDANYKSSVESLTPTEKEWVERWSK